MKNQENLSTANDGIMGPQWLTTLEQDNNPYLFINKS